MIKVGLDITPLANGHARRGVGGYTRMLQTALQTFTDLELHTLPVKEKVDLIHRPYFDLFAPTLPIVKSAPTVVTIHDVIPLLFPRQYPVGIKGRLAFYRQLLSLKTVKAVITDSLASQQDIARYLHVPLKKIYVTYLAANPGLEAQSDEEINRVLQRYDIRQPYVLYVGDINYNKNLPQLIKALKFLPDEIRLVCVGANFKPQDIPEWKAIETQAALSNVSERIVYLTEIASDSLTDLSALYSGAVAYIQPSLAEGFGLPVLEAMQCRTPVICAHNSSLIEVAGSHALMVSPEAENLAEAIKTVMSWSKTHRQEVVREAYKWSQTFSWEKTAQATKAVYEQVLS